MSFDYSILLPLKSVVHNKILRELFNFTLIIFLVRLTYLLLKRLNNLDCDLSLLGCKFFGQNLGDHFRGKVIWITGASSGIGRYLALDLAKYKCRLVLSGRDLGRLIKVKMECASISEILEEDIMVLPFDIRQIDRHEAIFREILHYYKKVDVFVNNAGTSQRANFIDIDVQIDRDIFENNVFGGVNLARIITKWWSLHNRPGQIVVTSSIVGKAALPQCSSYVASKHALHGYFESLRSEFSNRNIHVTMICSGPVHTGIFPVSYTGKVGEKIGKDLPSNCNRMSPQRHAHLMSLAIANKIEEAWITINPFLLYCYCNQYFPTLSKRYLNLLASYLSKARDC